MIKEYDGWTGIRPDRKICMNCSSKNLKDLESEYSGWVENYICLDCNTSHRFSYGDTMGGQRNSVTITIPD